MPLDTQSRLTSLVTLSRPGRGLLPFPDGAVTVDVSDLQALLGLAGDPPVVSLATQSRLTSLLTWHRPWRGLLPFPSDPVTVDVSDLLALLALAGAPLLPVTPADGAVHASGALTLDAATLQATAHSVVHATGTLALDAATLAAAAHGVAHATGALPLQAATLTSTAHGVAHATGTLVLDAATLAAVAQVAGDGHLVGALPLQDATLAATARVIGAGHLWGAFRLADATLQATGWGSTLAASGAWLRAAAHAATLGQTSGAYAPVLVLSLVERDLILSTGPVQGLPTTRTLRRLQEQGVGPLRVTLDERTDAVRLGGLTIAVQGIEDVLGTCGGPLDQTLVECWVGFAALPWADYLRVSSYIVDRWQSTTEALTLDLVDASLRFRRDLSVPVAAPYFAGVPRASRRAMIPLLLGPVTMAPTVPLSGVAQGTLALALPSTGTVVYLPEIGEPFPAQGTVTVESEPVRYTVQTLSTLVGRTFRTLAGLTRSAPVDHQQGAPVRLEPTQTTVLIGYRVSQLDLVREDGLPVDPSAYTLSVQQADHPVSVLTFPGQPGTITVDAQGGNVDLVRNLLTNGDFEAGTLAGWTVTGSSSASTSAPLAPQGRWRAGLTTGQIAQSFPTIPAERYQVTLTYQNAALQEVIS